VRAHQQTGKPVRVLVFRGLRDRRCSLCSNGLTVGVKASAPPITVHHLFCRSCAVEIGRVASAIGRRKAASK
jgi:hypothetical protein